MATAAHTTPTAWVPLRFTKHYDEWRDARVNAVRRHYGDAFFAGRTLLELGCGYGDIGGVFAGLGANVTCCDARDEHLQIARERWPEVRTVRVDLDVDWPFDRFDIILHLGVLYHLEPTHSSLRHAARCATHLVLETEVCDSSDDVFTLTDEDGYDQAFSGHGCRPSAARIERILAEEAMTFTRMDDGRCNSGMHVYDWPVMDTGSYTHGQRRFWFAEKAQP